MKIIFFGTSSFAAEILEFLIEQNIEIVAIVTQPDRPQGRKLRCVAPEVKKQALLLCPQVQILQPEKASNELFLEEIRKLRANLFLVVAYGQILSQKLLAIPPMGCINVHASLLPKYRGAAPIYRALLNGEVQTGIAIQKMVYQLDAGDVIAECSVQISPNCTLGTLSQTLCDLAKPLLLNVLQQYEAGIPLAIPQDHSQATYAPKINPLEVEIHWTQSALYLERLIRALSPQPGAWCWINTPAGRKKIKILKAIISSESGFPGEILSHTKNAFIVAAGTGAIQLLQVQPEGKTPMSVADWLRGYRSLPTFFSI